MLNVYKSQDCSTINACGDELEAAFNSNTIEKVTVEVKHNCCGPKYSETLLYNNASIATNHSITIVGSTTINAVNVLINNVSTNLLSVPVLSNNPTLIYDTIIASGLIPVGVIVVVTLDTDIIIAFNNTAFGFDPVNVNFDATSGNFVETPSDALTADCTFIAEIPTSEATYISSILYKNSSEVAPNCGINGSFNILTDQASIITANTLGTLTFNTVGDVIEVTYNDVPDPTVTAPHSVLAFDNTGVLRNYAFTCKNLTEDQSEALVINPQCYCPPIAVSSVVPDPSTLFKGNCLSILPSIVGQTTKFADGIYSVHIVVETTTSKIMQDSCIFIDCDLKCLIAQIKDIDQAYEIIQLYQFLVLSTECADYCTCEDLCVIYKELITKLNQALNPSQLENCDC